MNLLSAAEDISIRTLGAVPGTLRRLAYLAELRDDNGVYRHWGLERTFGEEAETALEEAHEESLIEVLRTPIPELWNELGVQSEGLGTSATEQIGRLSRLGESIYPPACAGAFRAHFNLVLFVLRELAHSQAGASTPRVA